MKIDDRKTYAGCILSGLICLMISYEVYEWFSWLTLAQLQVALTLTGTFTGVSMRHAVSKVQVKTKAKSK